MWIRIEGAKVLVNLDQVSCLYIWRDGEREYIRAKLPGGESVTVSPALTPDEAERRLEAIMDLLWRNGSHKNV